MSETKRRIEFGDFQTPDSLAFDVCLRLRRAGMQPDVIIEPTCGVGAFLLAAARAFPAAAVLGYEINAAYLDTLATRVREEGLENRVRTQRADFFATDWPEQLAAIEGRMLVVGNFPWVTNATVGALGGSNLPAKSNFLGHNGFDAISGKANFDVSEWMLLEVLRWLPDRTADVAMLVKTAVARKVLAHVEKQRAQMFDAWVFEIDAKRHFNAAVDACLLVMRFDPTAEPNYDYTIFPQLQAEEGRRVGHRGGVTVGDLKGFERNAHLLGVSPEKWRSGVKHDASSLMEFTRVPGGYVNGLGQIADLEDKYLFPLLKGSDIGSAKQWREKFVLVTQRRVGEDTTPIQENAPRTWAYLEQHAEGLDSRGSTIYKKNPRFAIFGVGDYAFRPWRIAVCSLYKALRFRLVGPIEGRPAMFDDTVYYLSFETETEAVAVLRVLESQPATDLLSSMIFWDEKRPIKTGILNQLDWSKAHAPPPPAAGRGKVAKKVLVP